MGGLHPYDENLFCVENSRVSKNTFLNREPEKQALPKYEDAKDTLPHPVWDGHDAAIAAYDYAWRTAFRNLRQPSEKTKFVSNYIDTAFNGFLFMWDSSFIAMFGKYGARVFDFQKTLDNFYSNQHKDGFISREICETEPGERFSRDDPASTGPNIMPWSEWEYYQNSGDTERLKQVFDPLMAYHEWLRLNRTWRDGTYWSCGLACGMDNQPRVPEGYSCGLSHGRSIWADTCAQQLLSGRILIRMAEIIGRADETDGLKREIRLLAETMNERLWSEKDSFYYDLWRSPDNGSDYHSGVKTIGAYWSLLADIVPKERIDKFVAHLENENEFNRPHRVPTLSADHPLYAKDGGYWRGGVWAPTNYMVLKGLEKHGYHKLCYDIACNHLENVVKVFQNTGTLWENYAPERIDHGNPAGSEFVGWSGLIPISVLFEYVFGIHPDAKNNKIVWRVNRTERHGVRRYPLNGRSVDILCEAREENQRPRVTVTADFPVAVDVIWNGGPAETVHSRCRQ